MRSYVRFQVPKELNDKALQMLELAKNSGKLRRGINEATKVVERGIAKMIVIAEDIDPEEIAMHLPILCDEKKTSYTYVSSKLELGRASGIDVPCAAVAVLDAGEGKSMLSEIAGNVEKLKQQP